MAVRQEHQGLRQRVHRVGQSKVAVLLGRIAGARRHGVRGDLREIAGDEAHHGGSRLGQGLQFLLAAAPADAVQGRDQLQRGAGLADHQLVAPDAPDGLVFRLTAGAHLAADLPGAGEGLVDGLVAESLELGEGQAEQGLQLQLQRRERVQRLDFRQQLQRLLDQAAGFRELRFGEARLRARQQRLDRFGVGADAFQVMRREIRLRMGELRIDRLPRRQDPPMQLLALLGQQRGIGGVAQQRVREIEAFAFGQAVADQQAGRGHVAQDGGDFGFVPRQRQRHQIGREAAAGSRRDVQHILRSRPQIQLRHERIEQGIGHHQAQIAGGGGQGRLGELADQQGQAFRLAGDFVPYFQIQPLFGIEPGNERPHILFPQARQIDFPVPVGVLGGARVGPGRGDDQDGAGGVLRLQPAQHLGAGRIEPVRVLHQHQQRLVLAHPQQQLDQDDDGFLAQDVGHPARVLAASEQDAQQFQPFAGLLLRQMAGQPLLQEIIRLSGAEVLDISLERIQRRMLREPGRIQHHPLRFLGQALLDAAQQGGLADAARPAHQDAAALACALQGLPCRQHGADFLVAADQFGRLRIAALVRARAVAAESAELVDGLYAVEALQRHLASGVEAEQALHLLMDLR